MVARRHGKDDQGHLPLGHVGLLVWRLRTSKSLSAESIDFTLKLPRGDRVEPPNPEEHDDREEGRFEEDHDGMAAPRPRQEKRFDEHHDHAGDQRPEIPTPNGSQQITLAFELATVKLDAAFGDAVTTVNG